MPSTDHGGQGVLDGRPDGKEGVGDPLQPFQSFFKESGGAVGENPTELHLWERGRLRETAEGEDQRPVSRGGDADVAGAVGEAVVEKDLVRNESEAVAERRLLETL